MLLKVIWLVLLFFDICKALSDKAETNPPRMKRSNEYGIKNATFKKVEVKSDGIQEIEKLLMLK